jgi:hypothetical protein
MMRLGQVFWVLAAADAVLILTAWAMALQDRGGSHDGGRTMGLFFFVLLPAAVLALAMLLFHFSTAWPVKAVALVIVVVPGLWFLKTQATNGLIERSLEADRHGSGYFDSQAMKQMGAAVVARDVATLMRVGPSVDVNAPGREMTLMRLAVASPDARLSDGRELPVVRALLKLGARPDDALPVACVRVDAALLELLLSAGANPNLRVRPQQPLVFDVMQSLTPPNFRLLLAHGLDVDSTSNGDPLTVQLAIHRRWDLLAIAIEQGADLSRTRSDGRNLAGELARQIAEETQAGRVASPDLLQAQRRLAARH